MNLVQDLIAPASASPGPVHIVGYKLTIGGWSVDSSADPRTELVALDVFSSMATPADYVRVVVHNPPASAPDLLGQAMAAAASAVGGALGFGGGQAAPASFSTQVRGEKVEPGAPLAVSLTAGSRSGKVASATVQAIDVIDGSTAIVGRSGLQMLTETRLNQVYENQTQKQIVQDLASQAGVATGEIETGDRYPCFLADESRSLERICRELALREGCDLYVDAEGKLNVRKFTKTSPDHTFHYGIDVLELRAQKHQPTHDKVVVYGESPASRTGAQKWHWLVKDLSPFAGTAGDGKRVAALADGALRSKAAADRLAIARKGATTDLATSGRLRLLGNPTVKLGDAIEIKGVPDPALNGLFKVVALRQSLTKDAGYATWVGFTGQGGAAAAEGLLGGLAGAISGALGL
jgi:hypothetical protein